MKTKPNVAEDAPRAVVRCIAVPVAEVVGYFANVGKGGRVVWAKAITPVDDWKEFDADCRGAWANSTSLANTVMIELLKRDVVRDPSEARMPKHPLKGMYSYPLVKNRFGKCMETTSVASICRAVEAKYRQKRLATIWRGDESISTYRYPMPLPVHNSKWTLEREPDGAINVTFPIGKRLWKVRLRGGKDFARQTNQLRQIIAGALKQGELKLTRQAVSGNTNRHAAAATGGAKKQQFRTMIRVAAHFPVTECTADGVLLVTTDPAAFWVWEMNDQKAHLLNADDVRHWVAAHAVYRQRMSEDLKYEKRWQADERERMIRNLKDRCEKQNRRLHTFCHQASAILIGFAMRRRVGIINYNDANHAYIPEGFPWEQVRTMIAQKATASGIVFRHLNGKKEKKKDA